MTPADRRAEAYRYWLLARAWPYGFGERLAHIGGLLKQLIHWPRLRAGQTLGLVLVDTAGSGPVWRVAAEPPGAAWWPPDRGLRAQGVVAKAGFGYFTIETEIGLTETYSVWRRLWAERWRPLYPIGGRKAMEQLPRQHEMVRQQMQERRGPEMSPK